MSEYYPNSCNVDEEINENLLLFSIHVVFGHVVAGHDIVRQMELLPVDRNSRPLQDVVITNCGELIKQVKGMSCAFYGKKIFNNTSLFVVKKLKKKKKEVSKSSSDDSESSSEDEKKKKHKKKKKKKAKSDQ